MERGMSADQLFRALWRRKLLAGAILLGGLVVGAAIIFALPDTYEATSVVRVESQRPGETMVERTVSELLEQRILTVRQELLATPVLQQAIEEFDLYPDVVEKDGMQGAVAQLRQQLSVRVEGEHAFELSFRDRDPELAQKVANRLPEIYAAAAVAVRREQAQRAANLFSSEVKTLQERLAQWEKRIASFKVQHMGELPEQLETNMRGLERVADQLRTKSEELRVAETRRSELARAQLSGDSEAGRLKAAEDALTQSLVGARTQWTADHPEVTRLESELAGMKRRRERAESLMVAERQERAIAARTVQDVRRDIEELQARAETYQKRLDNTPQWAQALAVLERDYEITRTKYQSVVSRQVEAQIALELEARGAEDMFRMVSPAIVPSTPVSPDRPTAMLVTLLLSVALAVLTVVVLELRDESIRDQSELRGRLSLPILAVVPQLPTVSGEARMLTPDRSATNRVAGTPDGPLH